MENGKQQLKRTDAIARGVAAEADAIGEQQLCTESCPAPDYSCRRTRGEVVERAKRAKLLVMNGLFLFGEIEVRTGVDEANGSYRTGK